MRRSIVNGNVDDVKTEYSRDHVLLRKSLVEVLLAWSKQAPPTEEGWVFAIPHTNRPYHPTDIQNRHIRPAGFCLLACPNCKAGVGVWCSEDRPTPNGKRLLIHDERKANAGEVQSDRLAYVSPYVPFMVGRDRCADEGAARVDASRVGSDYDECLRTGYVVLEAGSEQ